MIDTTVVLPLAIPTLLGLVIPLIVNAITHVKTMPDWLQSILYAAFSALAAVVPTISFDSDLTTYLTSLIVAWLVSMRAHYTGIPNKLISQKPYVGRHRAVDPPTPAR